MKTASSLKDGQLTLFLSGELDHHAAKKAMEEIERLIELSLPRDLIMDMSGLSFMDSSGIAVVLKTYKKVNELGGRMCIENVPKQPMRVLDASGVERIIKITAIT